MAWLSQFLLGRPGAEISFDVNPMALDIEESGLVVIQKNLAGDLKKSVVKTSSPTIRVKSSYLTLAQRNQFASFMWMTDTFLSFQTRDDWQVVDERVTVVDTTHLKLANSSATRLSAVLAANGYPGVITVITPFTVFGFGYGFGGFGSGAYGGSSSFDPGTISYDDQTGTITMTNPLPDISLPMLVTYTYKGWLVHLENVSHRAQGGWLDRFQYDFRMIGA